MKRYIALIQTKKLTAEGWGNTGALRPAGNRHTEIAIYGTPQSARRYNSERVDVRYKTKTFDGEVKELDFEYLPTVGDGDPDPDHEFKECERLALYWAARAEEWSRKAKGSNPK